MPQNFFLVEVGLPNNQSDSFVGRIDNYVFALTKDFRCRPLFQTKVGKFGVTIEIKFIDVVTAFMNKKSKEANWPSGGVHFDFRNESIFVRGVRINLFVMEKGSM